MGKGFWKRQGGCVANSNIVTILVDNDSWILPYAKQLEVNLDAIGFDVKLVRSSEDIREGWICFFLGCVLVVKDTYLARNKHNLVVHESDLPEGRGFAPMAWQILEGKNTIPICLLEASPGEPDAGDIWIRDMIELNGFEFLPVWRDMQGKKTIELCARFIKEYENLSPVKQVGDPTYYKKRRPCDSELNVNKTIAEQFNLFRVVDNDRYPAYFFVDGKKIIVKVDDSTE